MINILGDAKEQHHAKQERNAPETLTQQTLSTNGGQSLLVILSQMSYAGRVSERVLPRYRRRAVGSGGERGSGWQQGVGLSLSRP